MFAACLQPAIDLAEEGYPVNVIAAELWGANAWQVGPIPIPIPFSRP